ncbi:MAG: hypothetical protein OK457_06920 [Thaumarchaeota archaeon]|nr:hypothetical protein [Nitrososphaerota archaeon]
MSSPKNLKFDSREQVDEYYADQILHSIEKAFDNFGFTVKLVVFHQLEKNYGIKREDIPLKMDVFATAVDNFFGVGALKVRAAIVHELRISFGMAHLEKYDLLSAVKEAHRQLQRAV